MGSLIQSRVKEGFLRRDVKSEVWSMGRIWLGEGEGTGMVKAEQPATCMRA